MKTTPESSRTNLLIEDDSATRDALILFLEAEDPETMADSAVHDALREIDQRYYALGDRIYHAWAVFVVDRPEAFLRGKD